MWGGRIVNLNDEATKCLTYILKNKTTSNGMFMDATETKQIQIWQQLAGQVETIALHNAIINNMKTMWKMRKDGKQQYDYHVSYHHSKVTADYSTNSQKNFTTTFEERLIEQKDNKTGMKAMVGFAPMHDDGCMILILEKQNKQTKNNTQAFFLYIPFGTLVIFPGNIPYNSDFSFGKNGLELGYPKQLAKTTNHCMQIVFCHDKQTQIQLRHIQQQETKKTKKQQKQSSTTKTNTTLYKIPETTFENLNKILLNQHEQEMEDNTIDNEDV